MGTAATTVCHSTIVGTSDAVTTVSVRPADRADVAWMASVHLAVLPHGFFARLGRRYLRAYHRTFVDSPYAVALVAERAGRRVGFVVGPTEAMAHHRYAVRQRGVRLAIAGLFSLASRPSLTFEFLRTRLRRYVRSLVRAATPRRATNRPAAAGPPTATAVLSHVAVNPDFQRSGAGSILVDRFVASARAAGATRVELVTLADERGAAEFYRALGWRHLGDSQRDGTTFTRFVLDT